MFLAPEIIKDKLDGGKINKMSKASFIDIITGQRIKWTSSKDKKMFFEMTIGICCPKTIDEDDWKKYLSHFKKTKKVSDPYDFFDWAEDQKMIHVKNKNGHWDYIIPLKK